MAIVTWDSAYEAIPAGSEKRSLGDDRIRDLKEQIRRRVAVGHVAQHATNTHDGKHAVYGSSDPSWYKSNLTDKIWELTSDTLLTGKENVKLEKALEVDGALTVPSGGSLTLASGSSLNLFADAIELADIQAAAICNLATATDTSCGVAAGSTATTDAVALRANSTSLSRFLVFTSFHHACTASGYDFDITFQWERSGASGVWTAMAPIRNATHATGGVRETFADMRLFDATGTGAGLGELWRFRLLAENYGATYTITLYNVVLIAIELRRSVNLTT